jgi:hypothetical protein
MPIKNSMTEGRTDGTLFNKHAGRLAVDGSYASLHFFAVKLKPIEGSSFFTN